MRHPNRDGNYAPELLALFHYTRKHVTNEMIERQVPGDPGTPDYIACWQAIIKSGQPPLDWEFDVVEVICLTGYGEPPTIDDRGEFHRFRTFTSCVGMMLLWRGIDLSSTSAPNYLALHMLEGRIALGDEELGRLLLPVFETLSESLREHEDCEYPFCRLAAILLRLRQGEPPEGLRQAASELIAAEDDARRFYPHGSEFLLGLTVFDHYHERWMALVAETIPADTSVEPLALIRATIIEYD